MHAATINLGELFILLCRGQFQCAGSDSLTRWHWAVLKDAEGWKEPGRIIGGRARDEYAQTLAGEEETIIRRFIEDKEEKCGKAIPDHRAGPRVCRRA